MRIAFIGCGAAGRPLGIAWRNAGHDIAAVICRSEESAQEAVRVMSAGQPDGDPRDADAVVFATPDDALAAAAGAHALRPEQLALHLSGAHASTILAPTGARTASVHPLRAFASVQDSVERLAATWFFVEGAAGAVESAESLARDLSPHVVRIDTGRKMLYHAGAAIASNYAVTLLSIAQALLVDAGVDAGDALDALVQLARGAVDNVGRVGLPQALTGPAARGDVELVRRHIDALSGERKELYRALLRATLPLAEAKGAASAEALAALRRLSGS